MHRNDRTRCEVDALLGRSVVVPKWGASTLGSCLGLGLVPGATSGMGLQGGSVLRLWSILTLGAGGWG